MRIITMKWRTCLEAVGAAVVMLAGPRLAGAEAERVVDAPDRRQIQAAVDAGLHWLATRQIKEGADVGRWPSPSYPTAVAGFGGLAFLANGYLPGKSEYGTVLERAMRYVQASMTPDGYLGTQGNSMYVHAVCSLLGLTYLGMSPDAAHEKELAAWCRKSVELILRAQKVHKADTEEGGWRYTPTSSESDVSVTSWQLLVLYTAKDCGYEIDRQVFADGLRYVNSAFLELPDGRAGFVYRPLSSPTPEPGITGTALFLKSLLEKEQDTKFRQARVFLGDLSPTWGGPQYKGYFYFVMFYMAQGVFQLGDDAWRDFAPQMQRLLLDHQLADGSWEFPPDTREGPVAGDAYATSMAILLLSLDKQYLPMYQRRTALFR